VRVNEKQRSLRIEAKIAFVSIGAGNTIVRK
jgi:hypothetical protein